MTKHANAMHTNDRSSRPSLYLEQESNGQKREEKFNILDSIEPGRRRYVFGKRMVLAVFLVAATAVGAGILLGKADKFLRMNDGSQPAVHRATVLTSTDSSLAAAPLLAEVKQVQPGDGGDTVSDDESMSSLAASVSASEIAASEMKVDPVLPVLAPVEMSKAAPVKPKKNRAQRFAGKSDRKVASREKSADKKGQLKRSTGQMAKASRKDKDVELIAALLTHVSPPGTSSKQLAQKNGKPGDETAMSPVSGGGKAAKPGQDVIVRSPGDSTADLVKRCQALGFIEGQLCRARICAGHWGKDPACPSAAQVSNASTD